MGVRGNTVGSEEIRWFFNEVKSVATGFKQPFQP